MEEAYKTIEKILEEYVRPRLQEHGGNVVLVDIKGKAAYIKLTGGCSGCASAKYTLESLIQEEVTKRTDLVEEVRLQEEVSRELYELAKKILSGERKA